MHRAVSEAETLSQMKTGAEIALARDEIEALLKSGAAAGDGALKLERTSSAQGLLAQCRAHLRAGREPECIALAEALCRRDGPPWPEAHAVHGRALFRRRRWKAAAAQPSGDYMGKLMPLHWGAFRRRWEQRAPVQAAYNPLPNSREIQRGRALAIA